MENREPQQEQPVTSHPEMKLVSPPEVVERQSEAAANAPAGEGKLTEWRTRARLLVLELRNWFVRNTSLPRWLPAPWRQPLIAYATIAVVELLATLSTIPIVAIFPSFGFGGIVPLLGVVFFALQFGAAPGLIATVVGTVVHFV